MTSSEVRVIRRALDMSQGKLAETLGYKSYMTISRWETGKAKVPAWIVTQLRHMVEGKPLPAFNGK